MAFKGRTTGGYKPTTGKQLGNAKTGGKVGHNPRKPLPGGKTNVVTKATMKGVNPRNSRTQKLNANRVQRAGGNTQGRLRQNLPAAKIVTPRGQNKLNTTPFKGYNLLTNSRSVPAGKGNIRNQGTVTRGTVAKIRGVGAQGMPKAAVSGKSSKFGGFIGR